MDFYCSQVDSQRMKKLPVRRRSWTPKEERHLMDAFKDIDACGWKAENGFRNGFLMQLELRMRAAIPGTDIKGDPHINSKYGTWKKNFKMIYEALSKSGFNWNSGTHTVVAPPDVWEDYLKAHPSMKDIREKPFPLYLEWLELFGEDTANGGACKDILGNQRGKSQSPSPLFTGDGHHDTGYSPLSEEDGLKEDGPGTESPKEKGKGSSPPESKKRKRIEGLDDLTECMNNNWAKCTESIDKLASKMGHDWEETMSRQNLSKVIADLPIMINMAQKMKACLAIGQNQEILEMFYGFDEDEKCELVKMAIDGLIG